MSDLEKTWFIMYCAGDDSHSLVPDDCVVCENSVSVGDEVKFSISGKKKLYNGVVKDMGGDHDKLVKVQDKLNKSTKPKREHSFHEDRPRRAVSKLKETGYRILSGKSAKDVISVKRNSEDTRLKHEKTTTMLVSNEKPPVNVLIKTGFRSPSVKSAIPAKDVTSIKRKSDDTQLKLDKTSKLVSNEKTPVNVLMETGFRSPSGKSVIPAKDVTSAKRKSDDTRLKLDKTSSMFVSNEKPPVNVNTVPAGKPAWTNSAHGNHTSKKLKVAPHDSILESSMQFSDGDNVASTAESSLHSFNVKSQDQTSEAKTYKMSNIYTDSDNSSSDKLDMKNVERQQSKSSSSSSSASSGLDDLVTDESDSYSSDDLEPECKQLLKKLSMKCKAFDYKFLRDLAKTTKAGSGTKPLESNDFTQSKSKDQRDLPDMEHHKSDLHVAKSNLSFKLPLSNDNDTDDMHYDSEYFMTDFTSDIVGSQSSSGNCNDNVAANKSINCVSSDSSTGGAILKRGRNKTTINPAQKFQGNFFNFKSDDADVCRIHDDYDVYISEKGFKRIRKDAKTATALSRSLLRAVFTEESRKVCSVSGSTANAKGTGKNDRRPALDSDGVEAIYACVCARALKKGWGEPAKSYIKQSMNNLLCEKRPAEGLHCGR